jgi:hypothetical protein
MLDEVELDAVLSDLASTAGASLRPASVAIWLRAPS